VIEKTIDKILKRRANADQETITVNNIPRHNILKPQHSKYRLGKQGFALGDRIICTVDDSAVPLGIRGTIVGIEGEILDVLFDYPNAVFGNLDRRCSEKRGMSVRKDTCINVTNQQSPASNVPVQSRSTQPQYAQKEGGRYGKGSPGRNDNRSPSKHKSPKKNDSRPPSKNNSPAGSPVKKAWKAVEEPEGWGQRGRNKTRNEQTLSISNEQTLSISNEQTLSISNEQTLSTSNEQTINQQNEQAVNLMNLLHINRQEVDENASKQLKNMLGIQK
jgi:hypothetical protein